MKENLLKSIEEHLISDEKPSVYLKEVSNNFFNTPLEALKILEKTEQNREYHPEGSVWNHVMEVIDIAAKIRNHAKDKESFMLATLLHDVGKGTTTRKNKQGRWISYDHDKEGRVIANKILTYYNYDEETKERVLNLVRFHMHHLYIIKDLPFGETSEMIKNVEINDMILLFISDRLGRGQVEKTKKVKEIEDVKKVIDILENKYCLSLTSVKEVIKEIEYII